MGRATPLAEGRQFVEGLLWLSAEANIDVRRGVFRQAVAALGIAAARGGPSPLEGVDPERLLAAVRVARADGFLDDADWLANPATAAALYEMSGALPVGEDRIELARQVLGEVYRGGAATFVAVASRMAHGSARGLTGAGIRARVALSLFLPLSSEIPVDELALAMVSRMDLSRQWLNARSVGSLPERRLAARLLERAARRAAARIREGNPVHALPVLDRPALGPAAEPAGDHGPGAAWRSLLEDRETLVWRHAANARGLSVARDEEIAAAIEADLSPNLSPTEWRRAATALVASIACRPEASLARAEALLNGVLPERDPGVLVSMVWGLSAAADVEPEAAAELLQAIVRRSPLAVAESLLDLRAEVPGFGTAECGVCAQALIDSAGAPGEDPGAALLARAIAAELGDCDEDDATPEPERPGSLRRALARALRKYGSADAAAAHASAERALDLARGKIAALVQGDLPEGAVLPLVRDLDGALLESNVLTSLLLLSRRGTDEQSSVGALEDIEEDLARWLLDRESASAPDLTQSVRQLRALLHIVDAEKSDRAEDAAWRGRALARWTATAGALTARLARDHGSPLRRATAATVGRAFDALVRDGAADVADVFLFAAGRAPESEIIAILAEASRHPDVRAVLAALAPFMADVGAEGSLEKLVSALPTGASARLELVHESLSRLGAALALLQTAESLGGLIPAAHVTAASPVEVVEEAVETLAQLTAGATQRCANEAEAETAPAHADATTASPASALRRLISRPDDDREELVEAIRAWSDRTVRSLPRCFGALCQERMERLASLPLERPSAKSSLLPPSLALPTWLPQRRTLGGFYVKRPLGRGSIGSVFLVVRTEDRAEADAKHFALKVPDYDESAARSLSEAEFLHLFRQEATTLLALPDHPNLAGFVTFDAGCRPKPILVMELIEGVRCDQLLDTRSLTVRQALGVLYGVACGLEVMHEAGLAHLDVKPANVILKRDGVPVLVDFGLSGRRLRPGCGTGAFGAPEVWSSAEDSGRSPMPADVYAMGCLTYELLTGQTLFQGPNEMAIIASHLAHDGMPERIRAISRAPGMDRLAMFLFSCLRHDPAQRIAMSAVRREIAALTSDIAEVPWPIAS